MYLLSKMICFLVYQITVENDHLSEWRRKTFSYAGWFDRIDQRKTDRNWTFSKVNMNSSDSTTFQEKNKKNDNSQQWKTEIFFIRKKKMYYPEDNGKSLTWKNNVVVSAEIRKLSVDLVDCSLKKKTKENQ